MELWMLPSLFVHNVKLHDILYLVKLYLKSQYMCQIINNDTFFFTRLTGAVFISDLSRAGDDQSYLWHPPFLLLDPHHAHHVSCKFIKIFFLKLVHSLLLLFWHNVLWSCDLIRNSNLYNLYCYLTCMSLWTDKNLHPHVHTDTVQWSWSIGMSLRNQSKQFRCVLFTY